ncbi:uncharacterized protein LOC109820627 isoform X2 [Asparagus officinalis]|uniref:uncharacterized protein LOC109820627 isoform X2 n=1 Tax=Asparagus officinalis TaxID=4686 RepID=UPI00098E863C|nr:uncharacterized protein LOC109820627 isoform X2 [Asparagus officinalis]
MAYRRRHAPQRSLTFVDDARSSAAFESDGSSSLPSPLLAARAIRASAAHRDASSVSSAYDEPLAGAGNRNPKHLTRSSTYATHQDAVTYECTSMKSLDETKDGFWGLLARKAKSILEDNNAAQEFEDSGRSHPHGLSTSAHSQFNQLDSFQQPENSSPNRRSEFASSLQHIGGTIKNALEEGLTIVENRTSDIIQETRNLQIRRKSGSFSVRSQPADLSASNHLYLDLHDHEKQLKSSRDVANAMAAKAKVLLRELKTVKADLAFSKERCTQLEEENKLLRESRDKGVSIEDDDLIRFQLETLLEEKARLAHENSIYARENRFLREIVEFHQLTMQDVVYVNEGIDEIQEVDPLKIQPRSSHSSAGPLSPIISRPGSSNNSNNTSPRSPNNDDPIEMLSPSSPPTGIQVETQAGSTPVSPRYGGLLRQRSLSRS